MLRGPRFLLGLGAVLVIVASGCGSSVATPSRTVPSQTQREPSTPTSASPAPSETGAPTVDLADTSYQPSPAAKTSGKLTIGGWEFPDTLLPYFARYNYDLQLSSAMFDGLLKVTPALRYAPDLATNIPTVDNGGVTLGGGGMDVKWDLRQGMKWSNGQPITCDDIKATWQWVVDPGNTGLANGTAGWQDITGVDGGSGVNCVIHFSRVYEGYLSLVDPLLPAGYLASVPIADARTKLYSMDDPSTGVYSGPYIPVSVASHSGVTFKPNAQYETISGHAPYLQSLEMKYFGAPDTLVAGYSAGSVGLAQDLTESDLALLSDVSQSEVVVHDSLTYELLAFNNASFATKYGADAGMVIRAVQLAIDRQAIAAGPLGSSVSVADSFVSPLAWYYKPEKALGTPDVESARTLLANMGWNPGTDGILTKGGNPLTLNFCTTNRQLRVDTMTLVAAQLKAIGISVTVNSKPPSTVFGSWADTKVDTACSLVRGNFDVAEFSYVSSLDPGPGYRAYVSSQTPEGTADHTGQNLTRVQNATIDEAYSTIISTVDLTKIRQAMAAVQDVYASDRNTFELPLYRRKDVWLVSPTLHNFEGGPTFSGGTWNIGDWWVG